MEKLKLMLGSGKIAWYRLAALIIAVIVVTRFGIVLLSDWQNLKGYETYSIAKALVAGEGFSFPSSRPWPLEPIGNGGFHPTAWADPIYTFLLAGLIWFFGGYHQLAAAAFNIVLLLAVFGLTYCLGERLISPPAGVMGVLALSLMQSFIWSGSLMTNTMLAATFILLAALMLVKFLDGPNHRRAAALGLVLGLTALVCPSAQFFIPITAAMVAAWGWRKRRAAASQAILLFVAAALTVLPWTIRNYLVFGEFVPIRTGAGQITFVGVVATAGTVRPELLRSNIKPAWSAETPRSAVKQLALLFDKFDKIKALDRYQQEYTMEVSPAEYATMNEAQRDSWLFQEAKVFIKANPVLAAQLAIAKLEAFVRILGSFGMLVCLLAALGGILAIRTPAALILALWIGAYVGPFLLVVCYNERYRAPTEPLLVVLAVFAVWRVFEIGSRRLRILGSGKLAWCRLAAFFISIVSVTQIGLYLLGDWRNMPGWEAYWIAQSLVAGKGYSFPFGHRWLFDFVDNNPALSFDGGVFQPTAWVDPLYTFCLAGLIWLFGSWHQLAATGFNLVLLLVLYGLTYRLGERLISPLAGVMAVLVLVLGKMVNYAAYAMINTMLASVLVVLSALMLVKFLEGPSYRRAGMLGLVLGLTALGSPGAQLFIPVSAAGIAVRGWKNLRPAVSQAILLLFVAALIVMPWTVRNYMVFGEFVPVRTGFGQIAFVGVVATAGTVAPDSLRSQVKPPWKWETPRQALRKIIIPPHNELADLERYQMDYAWEVGGAEFAAMNEAQRDSWFLKETKAFLLANPVLSSKLAIAKIEVFARLIAGSFGWRVCLFAALGGLLAIGRPAALILALWIGTYVGPFLLVVCYYERYRAPIEPLLVVLAVFAVWRVLEIGSRRLRTGGA